MVDNRCAIAIVVRPFAALSSASCTTFSEVESSAEVASSSSSTFGSRNSARAIAMRSIVPCQHRLEHTLRGLLTFLSPRKLRTLATNLSVETPVHQCHELVVTRQQSCVQWQILDEVEDIGISTSSLKFLLRHLRLRLASTHEDVISDRARVQSLRNINNSMPTKERRTRTGSWETKAIFLRYLLTLNFVIGWPSK